MRRSIQAFRTATSFSLVLVALFALEGCAKKRDAKYLQGQGEGVESITNFSQKEFPVTTKTALASAATAVSKAGNVKVGKDVKGINLLNVVEYETSAQLLGSVPFIGQAGTKNIYSIIGEFTPYFYKLYKVALPQYIASRELTYKERTLPDGRVMIPLVGYKVQYYRVENVLNDYDEKTERLTQISALDYQSATHVRLDYFSRQIFEPVEKIDVYPADLFSEKDEWYYSETIIDTAEGNKGDIGAHLAYAADFNSFRPVAKIKFKPTASNIRGVDVSIDKRLKGENAEINQAPIFFLDVAWKDYRAIPQGKDTQLKEEEYSLVDPIRRPYVQPNFATMKTNTSSGDEKINKVLDVEIDKDYLSFSIMDTVRQIKIKYSFLKADPNRGYPKRNYLKEDRKLFGFFAGVEPVILDYQYYKTKDIEKITYLNRFDPRKKEIRFFYSVNTPEWAKPMAKLAVKAWDDAYQQANTGIHVVLDESKSVQLGDLRYNIINIVESQSSGRLFGFGPSIVDPSTGEIISATANIHATPMKEWLINYIRQYMMAKLGMFEGRDVTSLRLLEGADIQFNPLALGTQKASATMQPSFENLSRMAFEAGMDVSSLQLAQRVQKSKLDQFNEMLKVARRIENPGMSEAEAIVASPSEATTQLERFWKKGTRCGETFTTRELGKDIEEKCPEVQTLVDSLKADNVDWGWAETSEEEKRVLTACAQVLISSNMIPTTIHEMGHNLGLRHNFRGYNDVANFYPKEFTKTREQVRNSSIMEYQAGTEIQLGMPGKYDVAAIRFGYSDSVEVLSGSETKIEKLADTTMSINDNLAAKGNLKLKPYKFCTDEDISAGPYPIMIDPLCMRHDAGTTPVEIVQNAIEDYSASIMAHQQRYDRFAFYPGESLAAVRSNYFGIMARLYHEWRFIVAQYRGSTNKGYLEDLNKESYAKLVEDMRKDDRMMDDDMTFAEATKLYEPVSKMVYDFGVKLAFLPNRYCVGTLGANGKRDLREFDKLLDQFYMSRESANIAIPPRSCKDPAFVRFAEKELGFQIVDETGYQLTDMRYSRKPKDSKDAVDVIGVVRDRVQAMQFLTAHGTSTIKNMQRNLAPSLMDEPAYREDLLNRVYSRIFDGVTLKDVGVEKSQRYVVEREVLLGMVQFQLLGLGIQGKTDVTLARFEPYSILVAPESPQVSMLKQKFPEGVYGPLAGIYFAATDKSASMVLKVIRERNKMDVFRTTPEEAAPRVATLKQVLQGMPKKADAAKGTLFDLMMFAQAFGQLQQSDPLNAAVIQKLPKEFLDGINGMIKEFGPKVEPLLKSKGVKSQEEAQQVLSGLKLDDIAARAQIANVFYAEAAGEWATDGGVSVDKAVAEILGPTFSIYNADKEEYDSKSDIYLEMLKIMNGIKAGLMRGAGGNTGG